MVSLTRQIPRTNPYRYRDLNDDNFTVLANRPTPVRCNDRVAEELARYLFVWAMYLSISYCIRDDRHIRIRVFIDKLPGNWTQFSLIVSDLIYLAFSATVAWFGFKVINRSLQLGQIAPAMEIPIACLYASVLVCALLSCARLVTSIYQRVNACSTSNERVRFSRQRYRHIKAKYRTSNRLLEFNA